MIEMVLIALKMNEILLKNKQTMIIVNEFHNKFEQ